MLAERQDQSSIDDDFKTAMRNFPATVTVITARDKNTDHGMTVTAVTSVSMSPPSLMVCLNNRTLLHNMLVEQPHFCVNVLGSEHVEISKAFSGALDVNERFKQGKWVRNDAGVLCLESAHTQIDCRRVAAMPFGTHTMFVGEVTNAGVRENSVPLIYTNATYCATKPL